MSLINEALKKAQNERPETGKSPEDLLAEAHLPHKQPKKKHSRLWGFLLSILIVGLFSASVSTYLVYKILGDNIPAATKMADKAEPTVQAETSEPEAPAKEAVLENEIVREEAASEAVTRKATEVAEAVPAIPEKPVNENTPQASPPPVAAEPPAVPEPAPAKVASEPAPQTPAQRSPVQTDPAVWARLQQLEIRGIMSGSSTKVLIFDMSSGKTRSYVEGDVLDGPLALRIASIKSNTIVFEDYGGYRHNKPF